MESVIINGKAYSVTRSDEGMVRVNIIADKTLGLGLVQSELEQIIGRFNGIEKVFTYRDHKVETFINGEIYVDSFNAFNLDGTNLEYLMNQQTYMMEVKLFNPSLYEITEVAGFKLFEKYEQIGDYTIIKILTTKHIMNQGLEGWS